VPYVRGFGGALQAKSGEIAIDAGLEILGLRE
jgi:hypothetical protein